MGNGGAARTKRSTDASTRGTPSRARGRDQEVLDAAAEVFARKGFAAATVQDVADALGILKGSLYYYIDTKEDLLFRVVVEVHEAADALHATVAAATGLSPLEQLLHYVRLQVAWNAQNNVKISVYYDDMEKLSAERLAEVRQRRRAHETFVIEMIASAQEAGEITAAVPPTLLANQVFAVVVWPYRWFRSRNKTTVQELADACADFLRGGLVGAPR